MLMDVIDTDRNVSERSSIAFPTRKLWNWSGWPRSEIWGVYQDEVETEQSLLFWRKCGCQSSQVQVQGCNRCLEKYKFNWIWIRDDLEGHRSKFCRNVMVHVRENGGVQWRRWRWRWWWKWVEVEKGGKAQKLKVVERLKEGSVCRGTKQPWRERARSWLWGIGKRWERRARCSYLDKNRRSWLWRCPTGQLL